MTLERTSKQGKASQEEAATTNNGSLSCNLLFTTWNKGSKTSRIHVEIMHLGLRGLGSSMLIAVNSPRPQCPCFPLEKPEASKDNMSQPGSVMLGCTASTAVTEA